MRALRLLLVEDDHNTRRGLVELLTEEGHQVHACAQADAALARLAGATYDVLVTDLVMPGMTGLELVRAARTRQPSLPCFIMTGQEPQDAPGVAWIAKPIVFDQLLESLAAIEPAP